MPLHTTRNPAQRIRDIVDHDFQARLDNGEDIFIAAAKTGAVERAVLEEFDGLPVPEK